MIDALPISMLAASLALFWLSTRQMATGARLLAWALGAILSALAAVFLFGVGVELSTFISMLQSLVQGPGSLALSANWVTVGAALLPLAALFGVVTAFVGVLALVAFTPGERVERFTRRLVVLLIGVFVGGSLALCSVAVGFAGYLKPRAYIFSGDSAQIVDGDTLRIGDVSLRLDNIDALEREQACVARGVHVNCGEEAARRLSFLVRRSIVICTRRDDPNVPPEESFSRPVVQCRTPSEDDLSEAMLRSGLAVAYLRRADAPTVIDIGDLCTLHPSAWRHDGMRSNFQRDATNFCPSSDSPR
jgi:endonuclease YncB( thermonuclease family)